MTAPLARTIAAPATERAHPPAHGRTASVSDRSTGARASRSEYYRVWYQQKREADPEWWERRKAKVRARYIPKRKEPSRTAELLPLMLEMRDAGKSRRQIAVALGLTKNAVVGALWLAAKRKPRA